MKSFTWQAIFGQFSNGGLNAKCRSSYNEKNGDNPQWASYQNQLALCQKFNGGYLI